MNGRNTKFIGHILDRHFLVKQVVRENIEERMEISENEEEDVSNY